MKDLAPVLARILARYLSGLLIGLGVVAPETAVLAEDPQVQAFLAMLIGGVVGLGTELAYGRARRDGRPT